MCRIVLCVSYVTYEGDSAGSCDATSSTHDDELGHGVEEYIAVCTKHLCCAVDKKAARLDPCGMHGAVGRQPSDRARQQERRFWGSRAFRHERGCLPTAARRCRAAVVGFPRNKLGGLRARGSSAAAKTRAARWRNIGMASISRGATFSL